MDRFKALALPISMLFWILTTLLFVDYQKDSTSEFRRLVLDTNINYAVEAAVSDMIDDSTDLMVDHGYFEYVAFDPDTALESFCSMYLESRGMIDSEENRAWVTATYCKAFLVAVYDGYYVGKPATVNASWANDILFSMKQPYMYKDGDTYYSFNLSFKSCRRLRNGLLENIEVPTQFTEQDIKTLINSSISDALTAAVGESMQWHNTETIFVPSGFTDINTTNPIDTTTVLVYMSGLPAGFGRTTDSFAVGGARVQHERFVGCYLKDGVKMYQYTDLLDDSYDIIETFSSPDEAAEHGYEFDISTALKD